VIGTTFLHAVSTGELEVVNTIYGDPIAVKFSAIGSAFIAGSELREVRLPSFEVTHVLTPPSKYITALAMSPDGLALAWCDTKGFFSPPLPQDVGGLDLTDRSRGWQKVISLVQPPPGSSLIVPFRQIRSLYFLGESRLLLVPDSSPLLLNIPTMQITNNGPMYFDILDVMQNGEEAIVTQRLRDKTTLGFAGANTVGPVVVLRSFPKLSFFRVAISPGEKALAVANTHASDVVNQSPERSIIIWNLLTRQILREWNCPNAEIVCWMPPDGDLLVAGEGFFRRYYLHRH
jgi:WD40 repeat protein